MDIFKLKNIISDINNLLDRIKERVSEFEDKLMEIVRCEEQS